MPRPPLPRRTVRVAVLLLAWAAVGVADEGMWPFNGLPVGPLAERHGMRLTPEWLERLQQASVRFNSGGSGSFVSADGLVLTNHHVAADSLQKLGDAAHDYLRNGFAAASRADELKCSDLELNVLVSIEDVTSRVEAVVVAGMSPAEAFAARRAAMATIEQESLAASGLRSDVVTLYQGGRYHLYRSKKYTDVRLVFAPEQQIAFFGGDADNFEFPRFNLDICLFRAYENGKPARVPHHLPWAARPVGAGDLVFVSGHPGHTDRAATLAERISMRDVRVPADLQQLNRLESLLAAYAAEGPEEQRQAADDLFGVRNARKSRLGMQAGLLDPEVFRRGKASEERIRRVVDAELAGKASPYDRIAAAQRELDSIALRLRLLEGASAFNSRFFAHARTILRSAAERTKPNGDRLREYRDSNRESLELELFSGEPLYDAYETAKLADSLTHLAAMLGGDDPLVQQVLGGRSPRERAAELVRGTTLGRRGGPASGEAPPADTRRALYAGGQAAVAAAQDPMLAVARLVDDESRRLRTIAEAAQEVKRQAHAEITRSRFAHEGAAMYPDATFTLRLAWGTVRGYEEAGRTIEPITTFAGLFARAAAKRNTPPFDLPPRWQAERAALERDPAFMATPFNFVSTADIIGGNSGSPVVNRAGELVGVIFDGNIQSLVLGITYDDTQARAVAVDAAGIRAALARVYRADALLAELGLGGAAAAEPTAGWRSLFDGARLGDWEATAFGGEGDVEVVDAAIRIGMGADLSGITWQGEFPEQSYEIALEARRVDGTDFFCGLTFPVGGDACSLILGGWGGGVTGLSSIDGHDAADNGTTQVKTYETGQWYDVVVRVTPARIECFLDGEPIIDQPLQGRTLSIRAEVEPSRPLGIATYATTGEVRKIRWRPLADVRSEIEVRK
jgi:hypothetical protein